VNSSVECRQSSRMESDVLSGLAKYPQKELLPVYFYDEAGSLLYEQITQLPEYYLTRTEMAMLQEIAPQILNLVNPVEMMELGSGSSTKTRILLDMFADHGALERYIPIDISQSMLSATTQTLQQQYPRIDVSGVCGSFEVALAAIPQAPERLYIFLGSTIGNFSPAYQAVFMRNLWKAMLPGNTFLLGFDMQPNSLKPLSVVENAYNDAQGVTAQFNLNILRHLNKTLASNFNMDYWQHHAYYNAQEHQIEMHLVSLEAQTVHINQHPVMFAKGETIRTEISRKYDPTELALWFEAIGFTVQHTWTDENNYFGLMLLEKP